jgi:hypothetical protein
MRNTLLLFLGILIIGCSSPKQSNEEDLMEISFIEGSSNMTDGILVAYTDDPDSLWFNNDWIKAVQIKMRELSRKHSTILLFDSEKNMPNVIIKGLDYPAEYDKFLVCGYWVYPNGNLKFCFGGVKIDGNFFRCSE